MWSYRIHAINVLAKRELKITLYGLGIYLALFLSLFASSFILRNYLASIKEDDILISSNPLWYPLAIAVMVCSIYLALASVTSISREKDRRTLEVLFYGPIDSPSYILGKYFKDILSYLMILVILVIYFWVVCRMANFAFTFDFIQMVILSLFLVSCVISFGLFISTLTAQVRTSVLLFIGIILGLLLIQGAHAILISLRPEALSPPLMYLRSALSLISQVIRWVSPFSYITEGLEAVSLQSLKQYFLSLFFSLVYSAVFLFLSVYTLEKKGVRI